MKRKTSESLINLIEALQNAEREITKDDSITSNEYVEFIHCYFKLAKVFKKLFK